MSPSSLSPTIHDWRCSGGGASASRSPSKKETTMSTWPPDSRNSSGRACGRENCSLNDCSIDLTSARPVYETALCHSTCGSRNRSHASWSLRLKACRKCSTAVTYEADDMPAMTPRSYMRAGAAVGVTTARRLGRHGQRGAADSGGDRRGKHADLLRRRRNQPARDVEEGLRCRIVRILAHERRTNVRRAPYPPRPRNLPEQGDVELVGQHLPAAFAEDLAIHVLDHTEQLDVVAHRGLRCAPGDLLRGLLWRRHDHELGVRQQLRECHRHVARTGRQVDQQVVQLAPFDVLEELADGLVQHRPAPGDRLVLGVEEELDGY